VIGHRRTDATSSRPTPPVSPRPGPLGFRRILLVELVVDDDGVHAFVTGIAHRLPWTVRAPLCVVCEFIRAGVPVRMTDRRRVRRSCSATFTTLL
jgi:hypothetical protein